jgi:phospholipid/cholesterol/gamma-HCH transport system substrate-binding protein
MKRAQVDVAVGVFVLSVFGILMWGSVQLGALREWAGAAGTRISARFQDVSGLDKEAEVLIAGVPIGRVDHLGLEGDVARVTLRLEDPSVRIPVDSMAAIRSRGLLGEKVVEIVPGRAHEVLREGGVITHVEEAADIDRLVNRLAQVSDDIQQVSATFRNVLGNAEGEESVREILTNVRTVSGDLRHLLDENGSRIDRIVENFDSFSTDLASLTDENRQALNELVSNFQGASRKLKSALDSLNRVAARVEQGDGTLGQLVSDDSLLEEVDAALAEARAALRAVRSAAEEAQEQVPATILTTLLGSLF